MNIHITLAAIEVVGGLGVIGYGISRLHDSLPWGGGLIFCGAFAYWWGMLDWKAWGDE